MRRMPVLFAACVAAALAVAAFCGAEPRALYLAGTRAQAEENYILAIESYRGALAENPAYLEPMTGLAESFVLLEEYDEALRWVEQALRLDRVNTDLAVLKARILIGLERAPEARELVSGVLARLPNDVEARLALAECDIAEGKRRTALTLYSQTLKLAPESRKALLSLAMLSESLGDGAAAARYYETALRSHSADPGVQLAAASWEAGRGKLAAAEAHARTALSLAPAMTRARVMLGSILLRRGAPAEAAAELREAVAAERDNPSAWHALGQAYRASGDAPKAIASFASGLLASPGDEIARLSQENTAIDSLKMDDAARRKAAAFHLEQGALQESRNSLERAMAEYRRALVLDPTWQEARVAYARVFRGLGFPAKYLSELRVIAKLGSPSTLVTDEIEGLGAELADSLSLAWGKDQYNLARERYAIPVYTVPAQNRLLHVNADEDLARLFASMLSRFDPVSVPEGPRTAASFEEAFRASRAAASDWFVVLGLEESERSFSATAEVYLSRTGSRVASLPVFRTGNDRVRDSFLKICGEIAARLPVRGTLIGRQVDLGLIDLGSFHGVTKGNRLIIVRRGAARLANSGIALAWDPKEVMGRIEIVAVDEGVAEGTVSRQGRFDTVNLGDTVAFEPAEQKAPPAPAAVRPAGLLARIFNAVVGRRGGR
jgi:tetratricopeptide (TPR) repeat protein